MSPMLAHIRESECVGCGRCANACSTGAIVGIRKHLHAVDTSLCIGCGECMKVCPVPCIDEAPVPPDHFLLSKGAGQRADELRQAHRLRRQQAAPRAAVVAPGAVVAPILKALSPSVAALVSRARQLSHSKYAAKGPLKTPRALRPKAK